MAGIKIVDLPPLGRDLASTDLLELSLAGGTGSRKITGQEIMNTSKLNIGTTAITSGTVGRVLFEGTGNVVQESANLFWDETNGRLGIGTSSPARRIDILGSGDVLTGLKTTSATGAAAHVVLNDINSNFEFGMWGSTRTGYGAINANNAYIFGAVDFAITSNSNIKFGAGPTPSERMRIVGGTGNVLINTTTDAGYKLDVNGTARVSGLVTANGYRVTTNGEGLTAANASVGIVSYGGNGAASGYTFTLNNQYGGGNINRNLFAVGDGFYSVSALSSGTNTINWLGVYPVINNTGGTTISRGIYYNPTLTSLTGTTHRAIETTTGDVLFGTTSGTLAVGTTTIVNMNYGEVPKTYLTGGTFINGTLQLPTTLRVIATGGGIQFAQQSAPSPNSNLFFGNDSTGVYYGNYGTLGVRFLVGFTAQMTLASTTGNVLINTTTDAGFRLDVNGTARVSDNVLLTNGIIATSTATTRLQGSINYFTHNRIGSSGVLGFQIAQFGNAQCFWRWSDSTGDVEFGNIGVYGIQFFGNNTARAKMWSNGQWTIGSGTAYTASALMALEATDRGFLPPRMTQTQRNAIASPAIGLEIYQTDATEGKYIYKSSGWTYIG